MRDRKRVGVECRDRGHVCDVGHCGGRNGSELDFADLYQGHSIKANRPSVRSRTKCLQLAAYLSRDVLRPLKRLLYSRTLLYVKGMRKDAPSATSYK